MRKAERSRDTLDSDYFQLTFSSNPTFALTMSLANILQRRVKPRKYDSEDGETSSIELEPEPEMPRFNDSLSSSEASEDGESEQQHQTNETGASHETVRRKHCSSCAVSTE